MCKRLSWRHTLLACYGGYVTQAVVNNLTPLLFVTFQRQFAVSLGDLALLVSLNFGVQLLVDLASVRFVDRIGYRRAAVAAHVFSTVGLVLLGLLPFVMKNPYLGIMIAVAVNAVGGGIIEVLVSPIVEAMPTSNKAAAMSLLHSFYCWGYVAVVLLSTLYFNLAGIERWRFLPMLWALVPLVNAVLFCRVPLRHIIGEGEAALPLRKLALKKTFLVLCVMMVASGASEQAMNQWASFFAETGLGVSKTLGDLLGPCAFAALMGLGRVLTALQKGEARLERTLLGSSALCVASYLLTVFSPWPVVSLAGCALCGLSTGVMWPGTFSLASRVFPLGGTAMFALLALAGDLGCGGGPTLVGLVMEAATLKTGLLAALVFPVLLAGGALFIRRQTAPREPGAAP